jgi:head-to-tail connecting protein
LSGLLTDIQDVRQRIYQAFYADLFLMLANQPPTGRQITAREIAERHEEKLLMLGPVLERLHDELLSPLVDITFSKQIAAGILPPPPPELQDMELKVEFVSTLAQAQKAVGLGSLDRLLGTVGLIATGKGDPSPWDKLDTDQIIDKYADMLGADPSVIVSDDKIVFMRESRKKALAAQQLAAAAQPMAQAAAAVKTMGEADGEKAQSNLDRVMGYS